MPYQPTAACTQSDSASIPAGAVTAVSTVAGRPPAGAAPPRAARAGGDRAAAPQDVPASADNWPPADGPQVKARFLSTLYLAALARRKRIAALVSWMAAGAMESPSRR